MAVADFVTSQDYFNYAQVASSVAITDTSAHLSGIADVRGFKAKSVVVNNTLNQAVNVQVQVSHDGTNFANAGTAQSVASGAVGAIDDSVVGNLAKPYAYVRLSFSCGVAPTSGSVSATVGGSIS